MTTLSLKKGNTLSLKKADNSPLRKLRVELNWNPNKNASEHDFDLDVMAGCTDDKLHCVSQEHFCFFNQKNTPAIRVSEDNRDGVDSSDGSPDETLWIDLTNVPANATKVPVIVNIYEATERGQSFVSVAGTSVTLFNDETNEKLAECVISDTASASDISLLFSVIERDGSDAFKYIQVNEFFDKNLEQWFDVMVG